MAYASDPPPLDPAAPTPGPDIPQPADPDVAPAPTEAPAPDAVPSEAPQTPSFPDNGQPYDLAGDVIT